ncbi:TonB-dependent receptor plug domain-containing protein [Neolewinella agarilytica]|uniref:TonB dependent receptor n=1 Tax=Neolewinella agarilytica TaxID=478744 RepID=A0A1H9APX8_9BACT|nr:TonB-dependent receptor [Neolewinella agarilytica]SEP78862.1 TonB dependent receptor [Neolewinella agarilytica]
MMIRKYKVRKRRNDQVLGQRGCSKNLPGRFEDRFTLLQATRSAGSGTSKRRGATFERPGAPLNRPGSSGTFFLLFFFLWTTALSSQSSPTGSFTARFSDQPLVEAVRQLEQDFGLTFSFLESTLKDKQANCLFQDAAWEEVADCLFRPHGIKVIYLDDKQIALRAGTEADLSDWTIRLRTVGTDGTPLPFVSVGLASRGISLVTDEEGLLEATLRAAPADSLSLHYLGYSVRRYSPEELSGPGHLNVVLRPTSIELVSVTVTEYLTDGISATEDGRRVIIDPNQVDVLPGFANREVMRNLSLLPGINNLNETAGDISIRGGTPDQNLVLWDGIPVYPSGHYFGMISNFAPELVETMDVWRGQADAEYGGRVSGVIRMKTEEEVAKRFTGGGGASFLQTDAWGRVPFFNGKSDLQLSVRSSLPALLDGPTYKGYRDQALQGSLIGEALAREGTEQRADEDFRFRELNGRWLFRPDHRQYFRLSGFCQDDELDYSLGQSGEPGSFTDALDSGNSGISLQYGRQLGKEREVEVQLIHTDFANRGENVYDGRIGSLTISRESGIRETSAKVNYRSRLHKTGWFKTGLQWQEYGYNFGLAAENSFGSLREASIRDGNARAVSAFGSYSWTPAKPLHLEAGLRLPWYANTQKLYPELRLNGSYRLTDQWLLKAGYGANHQFPVQVLELNEERISTSAPLWTLADGIDFQVQSGREASLGIAGDIGTFFLDLELYHKKVTGLSSTELDKESTGFPTGDSRATGMDLLVKKRWGGFRSWVIYSLSKTDWLFPTVTEGYFPADNDRRHQLRLMQSYGVDRWTFSLGWRMYSGGRYTNFKVGPTRANGGGLQADLIPEDINAESLPLYHRLDLSVSYDWSSSKLNGHTGELSFSLLNLYGRENVLGRGFLLAEREDPLPGQRRFFRQRVDRLGLALTPNLSVRVGW